MHQEPILKNRGKTGTHSHSHSIVETSSTKSSFKTIPKRKRIIGSVPLFKTESESETDDSPTHSKYIHVLTRKVSHYPNFGVYQDDTTGSFKIVRSSEL